LSSETLMFAPVGPARIRPGQSLAVPALLKMLFESVVRRFDDKSEIFVDWSSEFFIYNSFSREIDPCKKSPSFCGSMITPRKQCSSILQSSRIRRRRVSRAYTTARLYPADRLTIIPEGIADDQAASSFLKALTARYLVKEVVPLKPGDTVLYHAAGGGVGLIFVQWATSLGIRVIGTVSTKEKARLALEAGCVAVINYNTEDFVARTFALTGGVGVKAVFDSVGKDTFKGSLKVLKPRGALVQFGNASGSPEPIDPFELAPRSLYLTWPILPHYNGTIEELATSAAEIFRCDQVGRPESRPNQCLSL
jgi:threonine dehydrogenase-like Zn-dependent dehydrogenase